MNMANSGTTQAGQRVADAMLRAAGGSSATFLVPADTGDSADAGQLGLDAPAFKQLDLAPAVLRRTRAVMIADQESRYELLLSATAVQQQVEALQLASADALFQLAAGVVFAGGQFQIESWSYSVMGGGACLFRAALRSTQPLSVNAT